MEREEQKAEALRWLARRLVWERRFEELKEDAVVAGAVEGIDFDAIARHAKKAAPVGTGTAS